MAQKLETDIVINLAGNLAAKARSYGGSMSEFARKNKRAMSMINTSAKAASRGIDRLGNRYVGLASTVVTGATVRGVGNFEEQMTRIGTNAQLSDDQVKALTQSVQEISNQKDIRIDTTELANGVNEFLGRTGDMEYLTENLQNMGLFMQAFGVDAETTGTIFAQFREKEVTDAKSVMNVMDQLYGQFAIGSVSVKNLAEISSQLFSVYQGKGADAILQMGALAQLFAKSKGNANEALTSIQAVLQTFSDKKKVEFLDRQGIDVFKKGTTELRQPVELLLEVLDRAKNDPLKLGDVFDGTGIQGLASLYSEDNKQLIKKMIDGSAELGATQEAAAKNAATFNSAMTSLNNSFSEFAYQELAEPIKDIADAINGVDQESIQSWLKWGEASVYAIGTVIAAKKALDAGMWAKKTFGAGGILGDKGKGGLNSLGATPVYVVNLGPRGMGAGTDLVDNKNGGSKSSKGLTAVLGRGATIFSSTVYSSSLNEGEDEEVAKWRESGYPQPFVQSQESLKDAKQYRKSISELVKPILSEELAAQVFQNINKPLSQVPSSFEGNIGLDLNVYDHRIESKVRSKSPFLTINSDPDAGPN
ncbi:hypothetical protein MED121_01525 [Marinomonas sp. MED121]|uniref:phage tail tape measure protein n=1 Tax=Marinomonas sp. MED121 TaxID=314277 RepID=UPI0000690BA5|nr:phage tail tape measure protein [Marinomonas sp. MED121]EAQ65850.1 hypothetical protein MED121_01525 [Marinomonas sp. MED121]